MPNGLSTIDPATPVPGYRPIAKSRPDPRPEDRICLDNVRSRALRSEKAWRQMAARAERTATERKQREAEAEERRNVALS